MGAAIAASSQVEYDRGVRYFLAWLEEERRGPLRTIPDIDDALCEYAWHVYETMGGRGRSRLHNAIYGIEHYLPRCKGRLVGAYRSERGWRMWNPPSSHPPINWQLTCCLGQQVASMGHVGGGVGILLGFDCYLRVSEIADLRVCDVIQLGERVRADTNVLISLANCKTGRNQSVIVRRPSVATLVLQWRDFVRHRTGDTNAKLFPDADLFRALFTQGQIVLGWVRDTGAVIFVPHSLRHGGASVDYLGLGPTRIEEILFRGRWATMKSTRHYIQTGPALMSRWGQTLPEWQRRFALFIAEDPTLWISVPPVDGL